MCGICGIYSYKNRFEIKNDIISRMSDAIAHRGPDDKGVYLNGHIGLGHRRLSIIDLSSLGHQPMTYENSGYWIVYNGEVYNYIELRAQLEARGYQFRSNSDTEVVLAAYIEWGEDAFSRFNGMWALAIYHEGSDTLLLCRDRYGIKPLYYYDNAGVFAFASEYKAFLAARDTLNIEIDERGVATALKNPFELEASGHSLLKHVYNLMPGRLLKVARNQISQTVWWETKDHLVDVPPTISEQAERFKELFENACLIRMRADVPVGTSLSGGLDSSSVAATLAGLGLNEKNIAFIHSFEGTAIDETEYAKIVIQTTGNHAVYVKDFRKNLDIDHLNQMLFSFESIYEGMPDSVYRIYQKQRESGVFVSLDGHGADEMLAGYPHYIDAALKDTKLFFHPSRFLELLSIKNQMIQTPHAHSHFGGVFHFLSGIRLFQLLRLARNRILRGNLLRSGFLKKSIEPYAAQLPTMPKNWSHLQKRLYIDFHATVLPRILKNFDLMSMANGVEVRMPFMDVHIVNFVFSLPDNAKIGQGYTKNILRQAMKDRLDDRVRLRRTKIGFNSPVVDLLKSDLKPWVEDCLDDASAYSDLIDKKKLKKMYEQKILPGQGDWQESLEFWKYISALKLTKFFKESNGLQYIN